MRLKLAQSAIYNQKSAIVILGVLCGAMNSTGAHWKLNHVLLASE
jgi:hypothetical protein